VTRGVNEVQRVSLPVNTHVLSLNRDATLTLKIHRIKVLSPHITHFNGVSHLQNAVRQGRFAVINMGNDRKVADAREVHGERRWGFATQKGEPCSEETSVHLNLRGAWRWGVSPALVLSQGCFNRIEVPVANIKSQKKRILTNAKRAERNKAVKSELRTRVKTAKSTIGSDTNAEDVRVAVKRIDMATAKGIIHKNTAARRKSRLMKQVNAGG
jgi:small subunit ribosomal protein S20